MPTPSDVSGRAGGGSGVGDGNKSSHVTMVTELGTGLDIIRLLQMSWEERLKVSVVNVRCWFVCVCVRARARVRVCVFVRYRSAHARSFYHCIVFVFSDGSRNIINK